MKHAAPVQLSLGVSLQDDATFDNFLLTDTNRLAVTALRAFSRGEGENNLVLWGAQGAGLTHLAKACCQAAACHTGARVRFLPLSLLAEKAPDGVLADTGRADMVCLDDLGLIGGKPEWEEALFHLFNRLKDGGRRLLLTCHASPASLPLQLADLKSRVLGGVVYHLQALADEDKARALQMRALARGMELSDEVVRYILSRAPRNTHQLFAMLNQLDDASLQQQRRLTIPFVKQILRY